MTVTIYHNPDCGTSRNTLAMIHQSGVEPTIIEYLETPPDRTTVVKLISDAGLTVREALRKKDTPSEELGLGDAAKTEGELLDAIVEHPVLLNRPFVVTSKGTRLPDSARPSRNWASVIQPLPTASSRRNGMTV